MIKKTLLSLSFLVVLCNLSGQDTTSNCNFSLNADLVSRYLWRGQLYSPAFNIQPYASVTAGQFTFGTWGSYALDNSYSEIDFYLSWEYKNFGLTVSDYCTLDEVTGATDYFNFEKLSTPHALEGTATFTVSEKFPLKFTAATFFYGNDLNGLDNYYSTYFELSYPFSKGGYDFNTYMGGTPSEGLYGTKGGIVNVGLSATKTIRVTDTFEIPVSLQIAANPLANKLFLVFGLTL